MYFHVQVSFFHVKPGTGGQTKASAPGLLRQGQSQMSSLILSSEDSGHCLHQRNTAVHRVLQGLGQVQHTSPPLALGHTLKF